MRVFVSTFGARLSDLETPRDFETLENRMLALMSFEEVINIKVLFLSHLDASEHTSHIDFLKDLKRIHKKKDQVLAMSSLSDIPSLQTTLTNRLSPIDIPDDSLSSSPIVQHMLELHAHAQEHVFELLQNSLDNHTDVQWFLDILESKNTSVLKRAFRIHPFRIRSVAKFLKVLEDAVSLDFARDSQKYHRTPKDDSETFDEIDDGMQAANAFVTWSKETLGVYDLSSNQVVSDLFQLIRYSAHFLR